MEENGFRDLNTFEDLDYIAGPSRPVTGFGPIIGFLMM